MVRRRAHQILQPDASWCGGLTALREIFQLGAESGLWVVPHRGAEHMKTFGRVAVKCMSAPPKIEVITPEKVDVR